MRTRSIVTLATLAALAAPEGCGSYEHDCKLNPYSCEDTGAGSDGAAVACKVDADCADAPDSPVCSDGECRRPAGAQCKIDHTCVSGNCDGGVCAACSKKDCTTGQCNAGIATCLPAAGEPCTPAGECGSGHCQNGVCTP